LIALAAVFAVSAQSTDTRSIAGDKWVISAKAGGVNYLVGDVQIMRETGRSGLLLKRDTVSVGDVVSTGGDGRAEILLNPGSYLRVAEDSRFSFESTDLEDLQLKVAKGSVILEVFADNEFKVTVLTPSQNYELIRSGVYRVDVDASGTARLEVWKGRAEVGDEVVKGGRAVTSGEGDVSIAKFDRDDRDAFETWSRERAKELARSTSALKDKALRGPLMNSFIRGNWNMYNSFGLWVFDPMRGRYCFLPFGFGWSSPYGFGYRTDIWWYGLPPVIIRPPATAPPSGGGNNQPGPPSGRIRRGDRSGSGETVGRGIRPSIKPPPFSVMQGKDSTGPSYSRGIRNPDLGGGDAPIRGGRTVFMPPVSSSPASAPTSSGSAPIRGAGGLRVGSPKDQ
jgi:hypothetical protein